MQRQQSKLQPFKVYVRWRPLISVESADAEIDRSTTTTTSIPAQAQHPTTNANASTNLAISLSSPSGLQHARAWKSGASFAHVFDAGAGNESVFEAVVAPTLPRVFKGATCNFFAYGHSGSGKTHTIIGYGNDGDGKGGGGGGVGGVEGDVDSATLGLCVAAAQEIFQELERVNAALLESSSSPSNDAVGESSEELGVGIRLYELRKKSAFDLLNNRTECHVREGPDGKTHIRGATEMLEDGKVRVRPIAMQPCWSFAELRRELAIGLKYRATGTSTVHDASSRTHAVLELEIVNRALLQAREDVVDRQSELVPVAKHATDVYLEESMKSLMKNAEGKYVPNPDCPRDDAKVEAAEREKAVFEARLKLAEDRVDEVFGSTRAKCLGGRLVFVDLAGSEYYGDNKSSNTKTSTTKQTLQDQQEGRQINADLFALKEVIRARSLNPEGRIPFRSAPLTMALREHFVGSDGGDGCSAMILTVSPAVEQFPATVNTLKYGNLVGVGAAAVERRGGGRGQS